MKVRDLLEQLNRLDPDLEVVCYSEDEAAFQKKQLFFSADKISTVNAEISRNEEGLPLISFRGNSPVALLEMIADD